MSMMCVECIDNVNFTLIEDRNSIMGIYMMSCIMIGEAEKVRGMISVLWNGMDRVVSNVSSPRFVRSSRGKKHPQEPYPVTARDVGLSLLGLPPGALPRENTLPHPGSPRHAPGH